jgi:hypothetical protein
MFIFVEKFHGVFVDMVAAECLTGMWSGLAV